MEFDLVISNGTIIDGTGQPRFRADLGICDGKFAAIAADEHLTAPQDLDAGGLIVAPGFVDIHYHSDWILPLPDHGEILAPLLQQGITTLVTGQRGFSPAPATDNSIPLLESSTEALRDRALSYDWHSMKEFLDQAALAHPLCAFMTDTILTRQGKHNPASFGTYPRVLGCYSRDLKLFPLEEAVRRMTSFPAERMGLTGVGRITEGVHADLVLFDADTVADNTTAEQSDANPSGIFSVIIGGQVAVQNGQIRSGLRQGRVLRR